MKKMSINFLGVTVASLFVQIFGLLKTTMLSSEFGAGGTLDAFYLANTFTISVFSIVNSAVTTIVIPELNTNDDSKKSKSSITNYVSLIRLGSFVISSILFVVIYLGSSKIAPNFSSGLIKIFLLITLILLISQQFRIQAGLNTAVLQNSGHFTVPRLLDSLPVIFPVVTIVLLPKYGVIGITLSIAVGYMVETALLVLLQNTLAEPFRFGLIPKIDVDVMRLVRNTVPIFISSTVFQIQVMLSNYFAGLFGAGTITVLNNANQIMGMFQSLFVINLVNVMYPHIVRSVKTGNKDFSSLGKSINTINLLVIVLVWGYAATGKEIISLLFLRGNFNGTDVNLVFNMGLILGAVLQFDVIRDIIYRGFYALGNTKVPMVNSISTVAVNVLLLIILHGFIGKFSIVIAPALGTVFSMISIIIRGSHLHMTQGFEHVICVLIYANFIGAVMFFILNLVSLDFSSLIISLLCNVLLGGVVILVLVLITLFIMRILGIDYKSYIER